MQKGADVKRKSQRSMITPVRGKRDILHERIQIL